MDCRFGETLGGRCVGMDVNEQEDRVPRVRSGRRGRVARRRSTRREVSSSQAQTYPSHGFSYFRRMLIVFVLGFAHDTPALLRRMIYFFRTITKDIPLAGLVLTLCIRRGKKREEDTLAYADIRMNIYFLCYG